MIDEVLSNILEKHKSHLEASLKLEGATRALVLAKNAGAVFFKASGDPLTIDDAVNGLSQQLAASHTMTLKTLGALEILRDLKSKGYDLTAGSEPTVAAPVTEVFSTEQSEKLLDQGLQELIEKLAKEGIVVSAVDQQPYSLTWRTPA